MNKEIFLIGLSLLLIPLTACIRDLEAVSESGTEPAPTQSAAPPQSSLSEAEPPLPSREPLNTDLFIWSNKASEKDRRHYKRTYENTFWTPNGKYFAGFYDYGVDVYNTNNQIEKQFYLPENVSLCNEDKGNLDWNIFVCDSGFYLIPKSPRNGYPAFGQSGDEIYVSDLIFMDWDGNVLLQDPPVSFQGGPFNGESEYPTGVSYDFEMVNEDLFLFSVRIYESSGIDKNFQYYYIPSESKFFFLGDFRSIYSPALIPQGIIWDDLSSIWLSTAEETRILFSAKDFSYLYPNGVLPYDSFSGSAAQFTSDNLLVLAVDLDVYKVLPHPRNGLANRWSYYLLYASLDDLQLKHIGEMSSFPTAAYSSSATIKIFQQYVIYYDNEGCHIFDTETGESLLRTIDTSRESIGRTSNIAGVRMKDGELQVILYFMDGDMFGTDSGGYLLVTKEEVIFYPQKNYININPDCTYYMEIDDETQIFSIKPFLTGDEEGIEVKS